MDTYSYEMLLQYGITDERIKGKDLSEVDLSNRELIGIDLRGFTTTKANLEYTNLTGAILRGMTFEDELLQTRLEKHRDAAYHACVTLVRKNHIPVTLMDVEHLFDGKNLYFYFLGDVPPELEALTQKLAATYEAKIQLRQFTEIVENRLC